MAAGVACSFVLSLVKFPTIPERSAFVLMVTAGTAMGVWLVAGAWSRFRRVREPDWLEGDDVTGVTGVTGATGAVPLAEGEPEDEDLVEQEVSYDPTVTMPAVPAVGPEEPGAS